MRPWDGVSEDPRAYASFPLVPFSGRVDHGRFRFEGRSYTLAPNFPPEPHAIHGDGWTSPWRVVTSDAASAELELVHDAPGDVLRYRATQIFWLYPDHLEIAMSLTNRGPEPMPFGLGHHPYFGDRDQARLSAQVSGVWLPDDLNVPKTAGAGAGPVELRDRTGRSTSWCSTMCSRAGTARRASTGRRPAGRSLIEADELYRHLVVYVPPGQPFFCVEPVSMIGDGFNLLDRRRHRYRREGAGTW